jgi:nicotinate-nucleotide pyrophosphorylase (carboxylating)
VIVIEGLEVAEFGRLAGIARELSTSIAIECRGKMTLENVRQYAEAGAQLLRIEALTSAATAADISFKVQPF